MAIGLYPPDMSSKEKTRFESLFLLVMAVRPRADDLLHRAVAAVDQDDLATDEVRRQRRQAELPPTKVPAYGACGGIHDGLRPGPQGTTPERLVRRSRRPDLLEQCHDPSGSSDMEQIALHTQHAGA